jgi:uncharacterized membrane protein HdeD (DUF308 family)
MIKRLFFLVLAVLAFFGGVTLLQQPDLSVEPPHFGTGLLLIILSVSASVVAFTARSTVNKGD